MGRDGWELLGSCMMKSCVSIQHMYSIVNKIERTGKQMRAEFNRAFGNFGAAPCKGFDAKAPCPLLLSYVLEHIRCRGLPFAVLWPAGAETSAPRRFEGAVKP